MATLPFDHDNHLDATSEAAADNAISSTKFDDLMDQYDDLWNNTFQNHASRHKDGGTDELDASDLAGGNGAANNLLQTDGAAASWVLPEVDTLGGNNGTANQALTTDGSSLSFTTLSTLLSDGGNDELDVSDLAGGAGTNGEVPVSDGSAVSWGEVGSAGIATDAVGSAEIATDAVGQSEVAANAVGRGELKTATGSQSGTDVGVAITVSLNAYARFPGQESELERPPMQSPAGNASVGADDPKYVLDFSALASQDYEVAWRYDQSSPPYEIGGNQAGQFIFVREDPDGNLHVWTAEDPPWSNRQSQYDEEMDELVFLENTGPSFEEVRQGRMSAKAWDNQRGVRKIPVREDKNRYMDLYPHPFSGASGTVHLLDPVSDMAHRLREMHRQLAAVDEEPNLSRIIADGYIEMGNDVTDKRKGPPGVTIRTPRWKQTS